MFVTLFCTYRRKFCDKVTEKWSHIQICEENSCSRTFKTPFYSGYYITIKPFKKREFDIRKMLKKL